MIFNQHPHSSPKPLYSTQAPYKLSTLKYKIGKMLL